MSFSPNLGRWLTPDPIAYEGGDPNLYRFVDNQPNDYTDPSGRERRRRQIGMTATGQPRYDDGSIGDGKEPTGTKLPLPPAPPRIPPDAPKSDPTIPPGKPQRTAGPQPEDAGKPGGNDALIFTATCLTGMAYARVAIILATRQAAIGVMPAGATVLRNDPAGRWVIYRSATGEERIQFNVNAAGTVGKGPLPPGRNTPETGAMVGPDGNVIVVEGMHRLRAAQQGETIPGQLGGVPGRQNWLDYVHRPPPP